MGKSGIKKEQAEKGRRIMQKAGRILKHAAETAVDLLFPRRCPVCDKIVREAGEKICMSCLKKMKLLTPPWCLCCGRKLSEEEEYCSECRETEQPFVRGRTLYEYQSAASAIYRFKYGGRREYADFFGEQISLYLGDFIRSVSPQALVPIPLHKRRERKRGYNQAGLLAESVGRRTGVPVLGRALVRTKNTVPLKCLNPQERQNNLKKAFKIAQNDVKLKTIIIIDDIYTTGSTIKEAAKVLKQAGAEKVYFITLAGGSGV